MNFQCLTTLISSTFLSIPRDAADHWSPSRCLDGQAPSHHSAFAPAISFAWKTLSATCMPDSFSHSPGLSLERPSWTTPPKEGPSLDTVIVCPGSFKALTTIKIILLNCLLLFIH